MPDFRLNTQALNGRFQILLRRRQNRSIIYPSLVEEDVIVSCDPLTGAAMYLPGIVDNVSPFVWDDAGDFTITPIDGWYDFTNFIEGTDKLQFTWDKVNTGDSQNSVTNQDGSNYDKGITSDLLFFDAAFYFLWNWLCDTECQILNCVEVKIIDLISRGNAGPDADPAGNYRIFEVKSDNLEYAPVDGPCQFRVKLREQDNIWHCVHKTVIWDNWQNWFNEDTSNPSTFEHPTFLTCIEPRPRLVQSVRMAFLIFSRALPPLWFLAKEDLLKDARRILGANKFVDAPLAYTYILNVAGKCQMLIDTIFNPGEDWDKLCIYFPQSGSMYESNEDEVVSPSQIFNYENRWLVTLADFLDKLKVVFCAEWYVTPLNTIIFKYKKDLIQLDPIYDYTLVDAEPIYGLKYTFNGDKKPAYGNYQYAMDGSDLASQEIDTLYSDIVDYDGPANNPMLEGELRKNFDFAATGFVRDGRCPDYMKTLINDGKIGALIMVGLLEALIVGLAIAGIATLGLAFALGLIFVITAGFLVTAVLIHTSNLKQEFLGPTYSGAVRLTCEQVLTPRLLLWDGMNMQQAKVDARVSFPVPNPYYNPAQNTYDQKNSVMEDNNPFGLYNYPLYFDGDFFGNMYPKLHEQIDNPLLSIETHQEGTFYVDLCPGQLNLYGVFQDQYAQIGKIVKVEERPNYDVYIRIGNIYVDYDQERIVIKGVVIRKPAAHVDVDDGEGNIPSVEPPSGSGVEPPSPFDICYKWKNSGDVPVTVTYRDCNNLLVIDQIIVPDELFCAFEIIAVDPPTITVATTCDSTSESNPTDEPPPSICRLFINMRPGGSDNISYIDCDGNLVAGVSVGFLETICGLEIISPDCQSLIVVGPCEPCAPCCLPELISATTSTEPPPCTPLEPEVFDFDIPPGEIGVPYEFRFALDALGASPPFSVTVVDVPAWMTVEVDPLTNELVFSGTPDEEGTFTIDVIATNCIGGGVAELEDTIFIAPEGGCIPIGTIEFLLPDGSIGFPYEHRQSLDVDGASAPYVINVTSAPAWMTITVDTLTNEIVFSGTPDEPEDFTQVNFTITNCDGAGFLEVGTYILVDASGAMADANDDQSICSDATATLAGTIGGTADNGIWTTDGDGTFDDDTSMTAVYTPGAGDIATGIVGLTLTAYFGATPLVTDNMSILIFIVPVDASFDYTVPNGGAQYCRCEPSNPNCIGNPISPNITGSPGGLYTAITSGLLFFDTGASPSGSGQVDIANTPVGTYTIQRDIDNPCGTDSATATITILALPDVFVSYPPGTFTTAAADQSPVTTGSDPGIFFSSYSATPAGLTIHPSTGVVSPSLSTPGTYTVTRIVSTAFCPNSKTTFVIIV